MLDTESSVTTDDSNSSVAIDEIKDISAITIADLQKTDNQRDTYSTIAIVESQVVDMGDVNRKPAAICSKKRAKRV
jgi:hypothetical protein